MSRGHTRKWVIVVRKDTEYIDLSLLPQDTRGKIIWQKCNNTKVRFCYRNNEGIIWVVKNEDADHVTLKYNDKIYPQFPKESLKRNCLGRLFNFAVKDNYKYEVGDVLERNFGKLEIKKKIRLGKRKSKAYSYKCLICLDADDITEGNIDRGDGCAVCSSHKVLVGYNDLWSTRTDVARMLVDPEIGYKLMVFSNKEALFRCPNEYCRNVIGSKRVADISKNGLSCPRCGDGTSYPNKFMYNLLRTLNIPFESEVHFNWCVFYKYASDNKMTYGIYDFVLPDRMIIVEMDSGLGHGKNLYKNSNTSKQESLYRDKMKDKLATQNGYEVIRINCEYYGKQDRKQKCIDGVLKSRFAELFNVDNVDWEEINRESLNNTKLLEICTKYNERLSVREICIQTGYDYSSVLDYLKKGAKLGICEYIKNARSIDDRRKVQPIFCIDTEQAFDSYATLSRLSNELFGRTICASTISKKVRSNKELLGKKWKKISKEEFNECKEKKPEASYGDLFVPFKERA